MFGKLINSVKQGAEAAKAAAIIQQITGIKADELMIANLRSRSEINRQSFVSMNAHEYAFEVMFTYYVDLDDSWPALRKKWITKDHPLRKKIIDAFEVFVAMGTIKNSYIISKYESTKDDRATYVINQDKKMPSQNEILKSIQSDTSEVSPPVGHTEAPKAVLGALDSTINHRRFLVNEKVVPKGVPTFSGQSKTATELAREENKQINPPVTIESKEVKTPSIKYRCPACKVEMSKSKLMKSDIGAGWKRCPFCDNNFQV